MTNNIQYRRSRPIKAQQGTPLMVKIDDGSRARQENARQKAISNYYFEQAPSIQNLARGAYHWAMSEPMLFGEDEQPYISKGYAPVSTTAVGAVRQIPNYVRQLPLTLASISSWLGRFGSSTPSSRVLRAEEAPAEGEQSGEQASEREGTSTSSTATPPSNSPNDDKNNTLKGGLKNALNNIGKVYKNALIGSTYLAGTLPFIGAGYATYKAFQPTPTPVDSLLQAQNKHMQELEKAKQAKINQQVIDSLRKDIENYQIPMQSQQPSNSPQTVVPTVVTAPRDTINPAVQDSIIKAFFSR